MSRAPFQILDSGEIRPNPAPSSFGWRRQAKWGAPRGPRRFSSPERLARECDEVRQDIKARAKRKREDRIPPNPLKFSEIKLERFPDFEVPRHVREEIGERLRQLRFDCGLSESRVGKELRLPITQPQIQSWERGLCRPYALYVERLVKLAEFRTRQGFIEGLRGRFLSQSFPEPPEPPEP